MHFVKTNRTYYKYDYQDWTQPVLTSDTSSNKIKLSSTSTYSGFPMYQVFDSDTGSGWLTANGTGQGSLFVSFPNALKISSITVKGWSNANGYTKTITIYKDKDNTQEVGAIHTYNGNGSYTWTFAEPIITDFLSFYVVGSGQWGCIGDIKITAQEQISVAGTSTDYDYYEDKHKYHNLVRRQRKYYKYEYETVESLPTYASANEGLAGKNGIAFSPADMYFCVAQNVTGSVTNQYGYGVIWSFGDSKFKMDSYSYTGYVIGNRMPQASVNRVEWSNDKVNWTTVTLPDTEYRKYYRFVFDGSETNRYGSMGMQYFNFTGEKRTAIEVQKDDDFDIYIDKLTNYEILNANNYYKFTINPDKEDAVVTINGQIRNSIRLMKNSRITWSVSAENYATQSGVVILTENTVLDIYLKKYAVDEVVFESNTAGTYDIELLENGTYEVFVVGAGGGGSRGQSGNSAVNAGGGSGGYSNALMTLSTGNYSAVVGTGGTAAAFGYPSGGTAGHGGDSSFDTLVAGGGKGGHSGSGAYGGAGGTGTTLNGNTGQAGGGRGVIYGGDSVYGGYGAGGAAQYSVGQWPGGAGYVKIVYKG